MPIGIDKASETVLVAEEIEQWAQQHTRRWCELCDEFKAATLKTLLDRQPTPHKLASHRRAMKMFLRMTRLLHAEIADPDFSNRSMAAELAVRLRQLENLWEEIHNAINDNEADAILNQAFPNES